MTAYPVFHGVDLYHGNPITGSLPTMEVFVHKVSEGRTFQDPKAADRLRDAQYFALRRGGYHWLRSDSPVKEQVANFQKALARTTLVRSGALVEGAFLMVDWERTLVNGHPIPDPLCDDVEEFTSLVTSLYGPRVIVYTSDWVDTFRVWRQQNPTMPLWYANYVTDPKRPDGGPQECARFKADAWQYTSRATVQGIGAPCDANTILNFATLDRISHHLKPPAPAPTPTPPTTGDDIVNKILRVREDGTTFVGVSNAQGEVLEVRWTGPGDQQVTDWLDTLVRFGAVRTDIYRTDLRNCNLLGRYPDGYTAADFSPAMRGI